jgi:HJR/Mrr/RecB family endonuclease
MRGTGNMRWTRTTMDIEMDLASEKQGKKVEMRSKVSGRRVGPCKG